MKKTLFLATVFVFFLGGMAQAAPLVFELVPGTPTLGTNVQFNAFPEGDSTSGPLHRVEVFSEPVGTYNFRIEIEGVSAGHFTGVDGLNIEEEVIDYTNNSIIVEFTSALPGIIVLSDPEVRRSNSFDLRFNVFQPNVGNSAYTLHWDTGAQPLEFDSISARLNPSTPTAPSLDQLIVDFGLTAPDGGPVDIDQIDFNSPIFTTTISGFFAPVPEPATMLLIGTGLFVLVGCSRRRFGNQTNSGKSP